ncbi:MAG: 50S ribosomal protein L32e [Candidatus Aenigmarchaeota archaeon]|nr:50S ribosomal protein L32e [Candidatus Aenigmarchaeota archaeon]
MNLLKVRRRAKKRKPSFLRQEGHKEMKLEKKWRRPRGRQSKLRSGEKPRGRVPSTGYSSPRAVRGLNRLGMREVLVHNLQELEAALPEAAVVIASGVGKRKRTAILQAAATRKLRVMNI